MQNHSDKCFAYFQPHMCVNIIHYANALRYVLCRLSATRKCIMFNHYADALGYVLCLFSAKLKCIDIISCTVQAHSDKCLHTFSQAQRHRHHAMCERTPIGALHIWRKKQVHRYHSLCKRTPISALHTFSQSQRHKYQAMWKRIPIRALNTFTYNHLQSKLSELPHKTKPGKQRLAMFT